jgi:protein-disulfide isomerase
MHHLLFERQSAWSNSKSTEQFLAMSDELGLDAEQFSACLSSGKYTATVEASLQQGVELGVTGTPAFFLNGYPLSGAQPFSVFEQAIAQLQATQPDGQEG